MKIRKATKKDLDQLVELSHQLYMDQMNRCQVEFILRKNFKRIQKREFSKRLKDPKKVFFVADEDGEIVGFISGNLEEDPPIFMYRKKGQIGGFYVAEGFRRGGLGKKLFMELKKWFKKKKVRSMRINVARCNAGAKKMYKSLGFKPVDFEQLVLGM